MDTTRPAVLGGGPAFPEWLPLVKPALSDTADTGRRIERILESGLLTNGATVRLLEEAAAEYLSVRHVVALSNCTAGLMLVLQACGAGMGDVVLPSFTFAATAHAARWAGGGIRFADVDSKSLTVDPNEVAERLEGAVAVMGTHLYGTPCAVERLQEVADKAELPLVYDAAHAFGSRHNGKPIGGFGVAEVFSLSPTKVVVAGEGGLVATNDDDIAQHCRIGRDYGNPGDYNCLFPGLNARMSELHAAVALSSLKGLDERVTRRNELVAAFKETVQGLPGLSYPVVAEQDLSTYKDLTLVLDPAEFGLTPVELAGALHAEGIDSRRYFYPPVHRQKAYAHEGSATTLPVTEDIAEREISPPLWSHMSIADMRRVAEAVAGIQQHAAEVSETLRR